MRCRCSIAVYSDAASQHEQIPKVPPCGVGRGRAHAHTSGGTARDRRNFSLTVLSCVGQQARVCVWYGTSCVLAIQLTIQPRRRDGPSTTGERICADSPRGRCACRCVDLSYVLRLSHIGTTDSDTRWIRRIADSLALRIRTHGPPAGDGAAGGSRRAGRRAGDAPCELTPRNTSCPVAQAKVRDSCRCVADSDS